MSERGDLRIDPGTGVDATWSVANHWCHRCSQTSLVFERWGRRGVTVQLRCVLCKKTEWRRMYRTPAQEDGK